MHKFLILVGLLSGLGGCASTPSHADVDAIGDRYLEVAFEANPGAGTIAGLHQYDGRPIDLSKPALDRWHAGLVSVQTALDRVIAHPESREDSLKARSLKATVDGTLFELDVMRAPARDPKFYAEAVDVSVYAKRDFAPKIERMRSAARVLRSVPGVVADAKVNLEPVLSRVHVETAISIAEGQAEFVETDLLAAFTDVADASAQSDLREAAAEAAAAMRGFADWLRSDRLPSSNDRFAIGAPAFQRMLHEKELIDDSLEHILGLAQADVERQQAAFRAAARDIDPSADPLVVWEVVQRDHPTATELVSDTRAHLGEIRQFLIDRNIIRFPNSQTVIVEETPAFLRATTFASMDAPGAFEKKATESYYYVTPPDSGWDAQKTTEWLTAFNYYTTDVVSIHEAYPGHFMQAMHLDDSPIQGAWRYIDSYAFVEGWAHYTEQMSLDEGFPPASLRTTPHAAAKYRMAQASEALLRLCRLITTIRMHTAGMTVDEATRYFVENCYYSEAASRAEAERAVYEPEVCLYTIGKMQLLKLREDWRAQEGADFSLYRFHNEALRHGQPPIRVLREYMIRDAGSWGDSLGA